MWQEWGWRSSPELAAGKKEGLQTSYLRKGILPTAQGTWKQTLFLTERIWRQPDDNLDFRLERPE